MEAPVLVQVLVGLLGAGGLAGWIAVWLKTRHEADGIVVSSAKGAVLVQAKIMTTMQNQMDRLSAEHEECKRREADLSRHIEKLEERVGELEHLVLKHGGEP